MKKSTIQSSSLLNMNWSTVQSTIKREHEVVYRTIYSLKTTSLYFTVQYSEHEVVYCTV